MKCPECGETKYWNKPDRPYCNECAIKKVTCTECNEVVDELESVWIRVKNGEETGRGHKHCIDEIE